jgi:spore maturation protein CgeB
MRIFLTLHPSANLSVPGSMTWYHNLYEPLLDIDHEVVLLRMDQVAIKHNIPFRCKKFKEIYSNELISVFNKEHSDKPFDLFFSYLTDHDVDEGAIQIIKKTGVPMANFSCNNTHQFYHVKKIYPYFDYNLHSEKNADIKFRSIGANPVWFPMAANPNNYYPTKGDFKYDVSFIGAAYAKRAYYVYHLVNNGIALDCFGPNWLINEPYSSLKKIKKEGNRIKWLLQSLFTISASSRQNRSFDIYNYDLLINARRLNSERMHYPCSDDELINIVNHSKINLGFLEVYSESSYHTVQQHLHLREFEIPMCGGLYITNYSDELAEFYEIDKEIITFKNEHELLEKVKHYLTHEVEAEKVRKAAHIRAMKCHTYQVRLTRLFKQLNFKI